MLYSANKKEIVNDDNNDDDDDDDHHNNNNNNNNNKNNNNKKKKVILSECINGSDDFHLEFYRKFTAASEKQHKSNQTTRQRTKNIRVQSND